ncbi:hypothetical protein F5148DRAFT_1145395 [Russula earlei]|uniref:Uncharacterized protein n=1 Tax=Russula earlei TaxID=71964 RepID=A0ACC0UQ23_9AGAM|nr:hypothetical protein F5148DRAFT_1145395 [Russula earlei]
MSSASHPLMRRAVSRHTAPRKKWTLLSLPNDTLVDLILIHLCVRDILRLRSVCKLIYELTHQPMVWKRILRTFHLPLPPLPPTLHYSFPALSSIEAERLVIRALAAEANWRSTMPKAYKVWRFCVYADVMSMKIVPGGKYVVASIREGTNRYALMLLMMEHRVKTAYPVAKISIPSKAYKLEAKYMSYRSEMGIMISYVRREPKRASDRKAGHVFHPLEPIVSLTERSPACRVDVSDYSEDHIVDFPVPVRYELNVLHCPLSALHIAEDPRFPPGSNTYTERIDIQQPPFQSVTVIRSNTAFDYTDFDVLDGAPYVVAVQERLILFKNLVSRNVQRLRVGALFGYEEEASDNLPEGIFTYDIRAIRILTRQRELLVVRTDRKDATMPLALELYKIPDDSETSQAPDVQVAWPRSVHTIATASPLIHVTISAAPSSTDGEDVVAVLTEHAEPPPVSVFVVMRDPWHTVQFRLWPERIAKAEVGHFRPDSEWQAEMQAAGAPAAAAAAGSDEEEGEVTQALGGNPDDASEDGMAVDGASNPPTPQEASPSPPPLSPVPLKDTTFRFQLYGPFFKIISYKYSANATLGALRILPGTTRPLLVGIQAGDRRATPSLHDLWAYSDLVAPPAPHARWPEDKERRAAGEAERGWVDAALKCRESPAAVAQLALPPRAIREKFTRGLVAIDWDDWSMSVCGVCVDEPTMIYLFHFAPTPTEKQDGHRVPIPVPDVDERFRKVPETDPYAMSGIISGNTSK